ncbi:hypothetical protein H6P81_006383 [Aristolochia fimbriata]|uniref:Uncharacterized protein n=1 Tax=Aristolochia fimbriata TaxID=158543 RepID=A0AAV7EY38_ARIFI|nr:hypothetical protein H6P81_006383 [Aristolochia fimbriata]
MSIFFDFCFQHRRGGKVGPLLGLRIRFSATNDPSRMWSSMEEETGFLVSRWRRGKASRVERHPGRRRPCWWGRNTTVVEAEWGSSAEEGNAALGFKEEEEGSRLGGSGPQQKLAPNYFTASI